MNIKLIKLVQAIPVLSYLSESKFTASTTLKIMRLMRTIKPELDDYDRVRNEMVRKYGQENGETITVKPELVGDFAKEMNPVLDQEIELNITPISIELITVDLSPNDLEKIEWMIDFGE